MVGRLPGGDGAPAVRRPGLCRGGEVHPPVCGVHPLPAATESAVRRDTAALCGVHPPVAVAAG
eukprot:413361-Pleurochrysis_carterae.AAC.1